MRVLVSIVSLIALPAAAAACWAGLVQFARSPLAGWALVGCLLGVILERFLRRWPWVHVFEHELTHALVALLFLHPITRFVVTDRGGWVGHRAGRGGAFGNDAIGLAPYVLPTFTLVSVLIRPWLPSASFPWFDVWTGITLGYHTVSTINETRANWHKETFTRVDTSETTRSDIGMRGYAYSAIFILTGTLLIYGLTFAGWARGYPGIAEWSGVLWRGIRATIGDLHAWLATAAGQLAALVGSLG